MDKVQCACLLHTLHLQFESRELLDGLVHRRLQVDVSPPISLTPSQSIIQQSLPDSTFATFPSFKLAFNERTVSPCLATAAWAA
jgi:hypothetical protein